MENGHVVAFTFAVTDDNKDESKATAGKILVFPFDGVKFDADSGGLLVTGTSGRSVGRGPGGIAGRNTNTDNMKAAMVDLSGKAVATKGIPRSGMYLVQTADRRWIKKFLDFGNGR